MSISIPSIISKPAAIIAAVIVVLLFIGYRFFFGAAAVEILTVQQGSVEELVHGPARIRARVPVSVSSRFAAEILDITVDIGDRVHAGQLLVRLDDRDLQARTSASRAMLARAEADLALAGSNEQRDREVFEKGYISRAAMEATSTLRSSNRPKLPSQERRSHTPPPSPNTPCSSPPWMASLRQGWLKQATMLHRGLQFCAWSIPVPFRRLH